MRRLVAGIGLALTLGLTAACGAGSSGGPPGEASSMYSAGDQQACQDMATIPAVSTNGQDEGTIQTAANTATNKQLVSDLTVVFGEINGQMYAGESTVQAAEDQANKDCAAVKADQALPQSDTYRGPETAAQSAADASNAAANPGPAAQEGNTCTAQSLFCPVADQVTDPAGNTCAALDDSGYCPGDDPAPTSAATSAAPTPASSSSSLTCEGSIQAGPNTSCTFAVNVEQYWHMDTAGNPGKSFSVPDPDAGKSVVMTCSGSQQVTCTGGGMTVQFSS